MIFSQLLPRVATLVSQHDFVLDAPAPEPSTGLPLGNGGIRASLYGGPGLLALSVRKGDAHVGEIVLHLPGHESQPSPPIHLRLYDATARIALPEGIEIEAFVAATRGLIVLRVRSQGAVLLPAALELLRPADPAFPPPQVRCDGPFRYLRQDLSASLSAVLCGFVYGARSHSVVRENAVLATFEAPPSGECLILAGVATSRDGPDPARTARAEVERALPHGYLLLQREHAVWWERFWARAEAEGSEDTDYRDLYLSTTSP